MTDVTKEYQKSMLARKDEQLSMAVPPRQQPQETFKRPVRKNRRICYTCRPKPYVERFTFYNTEHLLFHFDLIRRPYIIITPKKHVETPYDLDEKELFDLYNSVNTFCKDRNIKDYQLSTNMGAWKTHAHLHWKLKIPENICFRMKTDHFTLLHLEKNYSAHSICVQPDAVGNVLVLER